jgi:hypothetical protein
MPRWTAVSWSIALAGALAGTLSCGDVQPATDDPLKQFTAAAEQMKKAAESFTATRKPVPPVAFGELIAYLPKKMAGMKGQEPKGETTAAGSWRYSQAEVSFRAADGKRTAEIGIFDYAHIPFLYVPFNMFLTMDVARESTEGYERSTKIEGYPGFEQWSRDGKSEALALVGERFIVKAETQGMDEGAARKIVEAMDLKGLEAKGR